MRVMVLVKATAESEAGVMPSQELLTAMGRFNEEIAKAGILEAAAGLKASSNGVRVRFSGQNPHHHRRPVRRNQRTRRRLLDLERRFARRSDRVGPSLPEPDDKRIGHRDPAAVRDGGFRRRPHARGPRAARRRSGVRQGAITSEGVASLEAVYRRDRRRIFATLVRLLGSFELAEDAEHDAFIAAAAQWPTRGRARQSGRLARLGRPVQGDRPLRRDARFSSASTTTPTWSRQIARSRARPGRAGGERSRTTACA